MSRCGDERAERPSLLAYGEAIDFAARNSGLRIGTLYFRIMRSVCTDANAARQQERYLLYFQVKLAVNRNRSPRTGVEAPGFCTFELRLERR